MASRLVALCVGANDPDRLAQFWAGVLRREVADDGRALLPNDDTEFRIDVRPTEEPRRGPNRMHFDLTSASPAEQQQTVARALDLGARHLDVGQRPDEDHVVLADPEGNEFCVIEAGNRFLAGCGFLGALNGEGTRQVGYFWSAALGWPLVWDQDEETAIRSPRGGAKFAWGGPPLPPKTGRNRMHLHLAPVDVDRDAEVDRLVALGATRLDTPEDDSDLMVLADPDGNELCVVGPGSQ